MISVVIPAHNPDAARLRLVLAALRAQTLPIADWETIVVDNASTRWPDERDLAAWAPANVSVLREGRLGLSAARRAGLAAARGSGAVLVDDDNVLAPDYLACAGTLLASRPAVGIAGGRVLPRFESEPPAWAREFFGLLALCDHGPVELIAPGARGGRLAEGAYPRFAPVGAGMVLRREAAAAWLGQPADRPAPTDRRGAELSSGGDNDIVLHALRAGWEVCYNPALRLEHLVPAARLQADYLARLNRGIQRSWMQVLSAHGVNPWPPLTPAGARLRQAKAWFAYRGWSRPVGRIRWQGACGHFDGRVPPPPGKAGSP